MCAAGLSSTMTFLKDTIKISLLSRASLCMVHFTLREGGRRQRDIMKLLNVDKIIEMVEKGAADLVTQLNSRMEDQFSSEEDINVILNTRVLL